MRHLIFPLLALALSAAALAQEGESDEPVQPGPWNLRFDIGLNVNQSAVSDNWSGDENGSWNWILNGLFKADRQFTEHFSLSNELQMSYGETSKQDEIGGERRWSRPDKTTDLIQFESVGRFDYGFWLEPYLSFRLDTVFEGDTGTAFDPYKLTESGGVAHAFYKTEERELIARAGFGFRQSAKRTGGERVVHDDGGLEFQVQAIHPMWDNSIVYTGKFLLFLPLFYDQSDALKDYDTIVAATYPEREQISEFWQRPDINWQNTFTAQINKVLSVNLYVQLVYDKFDEATQVDTGLPVDELIDSVTPGIRKAGQFKQTLALGITYRLF